MQRISSISGWYSALSLDFPLLFEAGDFWLASPSGGSDTTSAIKGPLGSGRSTVGS
jgi:hypothetical protein